MAQILLDVEGFQTICDFETGEPMDGPETELMEKIMEITPDIPYPGDRNKESIKWTIDAALEIDKLIKPDYMFLSFATAMMMRTHDVLTKEENKALDDETFSQLERFFAETDYIPVVVGGGKVSPIIAELDFSPLSRLPIFSACNKNIAGLFDSEPGDEEKLRNTKGIGKVFTKEEYIAANPGLSQRYIDMLPDFFAERENGYAFTAVAKRGFPQITVCDIEEELPVYTTLGEPEHIRDIYPMVNDALTEGKRVCVVVLEAVGKDEFRLPYKMVNAKEDLMYYDQGHALYFVLNTGRKYSMEDYPPIARTEVHMNTTERYPFSQFFSVMPCGTMGRRPDKVTAAVGTRSGFVHECTMADVCLECHSRNVSDSGVFVLVNDKK